jgi:predicted RNA binding protein YcfA (HicA-like mRNA interferase family)
LLVIRAGTKEIYSGRRVKGSHHVYDHGK